MQNKNNAKCSICGSPYYRCMSCRDAISANPWKEYTDTAEHYKVFQVVRGYSTKIYTKDEARKKLKNINLEDLESFRPHIKDIIKDVLKEEKPVVKIVEKVEENVKVDIEPEMNIASEEKMVIEKPVISRKRNYKLNNETEAE